MGTITNARAQELTIGGLSELTAVNIETIRYYERIRMLPAPPRTPGGRRVYDANHLRILAFIGAGYWLVYRPSKVACVAGDACARQLSSRLIKIALIAATVMVIAAVAFDFLAPYVLSITNGVRK